MDATLVLVALAVVIAAGMAGFLVGRQHALSAPVPVVEPSPAMLEELADLRHLKAQLDNPPQRHEHLWKREPDVRKRGWLRYRCAYANCPQVRWEPA